MWRISYWKPEGVMGVLRTTTAGYYSAKTLHDRNLGDQ